MKRSAGAEQPPAHDRDAPLKLPEHGRNVDSGGRPDRHGSSSVSHSGGAEKIADRRLILDAATLPVPRARAGSALAALCAVLMLSSGTVGEAAPTESFEARDLFALEIATDPQIAPDGDMVAYVRLSNDIMSDSTLRSIWLVDVASAAQRPVEEGQAQSLPRWSPDGTRLAFVSGNAEGTARIAVYATNSGQTATIVNLPRAPASISWSPDGTAIAYSLFVPEELPLLGEAMVAPEGAVWAAPVRLVDTVTYRADGSGLLVPGAMQIFVVAAAGGEPRRLTEAGFRRGIADEGNIAWAADGGSLYFSGIPATGRDRDSYDSEVFMVEIGTGHITAITDRVGPDTGVTVAPGGRLLAYSGYSDRRLGHHDPVLYVVATNGTGSHGLTDGLDRAVASPVWAADGLSIFATLDDSASRSVVRITLDGSIETVATGLAGPRLYLPYVGGAFSVARDGTIAFTGGSFDRPADIMIMRAGERRQLTRNNDDLLAGKRLAGVSELDLVSSDGRDIDAWLVTPPDFDPERRYPLILEIHGGPFGAYGPFFSSDHQLFAAAGYVVLFVNPRGSTSYGSEFANLIHHQFPGDDYDDLMSAVDAAIGEGFIDEERLYVTGGSGGGTLTAWIIGKTNRFRAAATYKPIINWSSFVLTSDLPNVFARYWFGTYPWENPQAYWRRSPVSLAGEIETPTLVLVGTEDHRTPPSEAEQFYQALQLRGVPAALLLIPGASHGGALRPSHDIARLRATLAWFERYGASAAEDAAVR